LELRTHLIDETVARVDVRKIARSNRGRNKAIVCLVGVQTSQFPRAADLAREFRKSGVTVLIGGFHVSGLLNTVSEIPAQMQDLLDSGVCLVKGEVEEAWDEILKDAVLDRLEPLYDFTETRPDLEHAPVPLVDRKYLKRFASSDFGTVDCGRGCPYKCSFCTIINVQGQKMRFRSPEAIEQAIRENYRARHVWFYFFTDDNFARNRNWEKIFDALTRLREIEGIPVSFMMQVDTQSHRIPRFIDKAASAGCSNVFIGMESINEENLKAAGKNQNNVGDYRNLIEAYRTAGIVTHAGYIVGFPHDTAESVQADLDRLMNEVQVDMASFFILTPLPGSHDYVRYLRDGVDLDPDFNNYDSFHQTMPHPGFPEKGSLVKTSHHAWNTFYNRHNMARVLNRCGEKRYWQLFRNFIWYKTAIVVERRHPMMAGFLRLKGRKQLRPGLAPLPRLEYLKTRAKELRLSMSALSAVFLEMQMLWLETRKQSELEKRIRTEIGQLSVQKIHLSDVQRAYAGVRASLPSVTVPSKLKLFFQKWNPFTLSGQFYRSEEVLGFWKRTSVELNRGRAWCVLRPTVIKRAWLDFKVTAHFAWALALKTGGEVSS